MLGLADDLVLAALRMWANVALKPVPVGAAEFNVGVAALDHTGAASTSDGIQRKERSSNQAADHLDPCYPGETWTREQAMPANLPRAFRHRLPLPQLALMVLLFGPAHAQKSSSSGPFEEFTGVWSGSGTIALSNGRTERLRCEAAYAAASAGSNLRQNLSCRSDSYVFELRTDVNYKGGRISGQWSETSRNLVGRITGQARGGRVDAVAEGSGFSAEIAMRTRGNRQSVSIRSQGTELSRIDIDLNRTR